MPWRTNEPFNLESWVKEYAQRRAGHHDEAVIDAWQILNKEVLVDPVIGIHNHSIIYQVSPVLDLNKSHWTTNTSIPYKNNRLANALNRLLQADEVSKNSDSYGFDVVNLTRQVLGNYGRKLHQDMIKAYDNKDILLFRKCSFKFITLGMEIDSLLGTRHEFLLGKWLADARSWGVNKDEKNYYERNAREIITTWHTAGGDLTDYSSRQWNGMISSYYLPRWIEFIKRLDDSMVQHKPYDSKKFEKWCTAFEKDWVNTSATGFAEIENGNQIHYSTRLFNKYKIEISDDK